VLVKPDSAEKKMVRETGTKRQLRRTPLS